MLGLWLSAQAILAVTYFTNVWIEVETYPTGVGKVYVTSNDAAPVMETGWGENSTSRFTMNTDGESFYYKVENGEFVQYSIPCLFGIVQADGGEDYECVGLVKQVRQDNNYSAEDYYYGGPAVFDKSPRIKYFFNSSSYGKKIALVGQEGVFVDVNSGRDGEKYKNQEIISYDDYNRMKDALGEEAFYWYLHDKTAEEGTWPEHPTKIYAVFKEKETAVMDESGQMIFSSVDNLKIQDGCGLQAYVVYKVEDGVAQLKATDSIPANIGVLLKGEPGKEYKFDRIPEPKKLTIQSNGETKTYNALLCEIYGFYPEDEILYRFGNYEYGAGFYKVPAGEQTDRDFLTMAIPGGTPPEFFTIEGFTTGVLAPKAATASNGVVYNAAGQQVGKAAKGLLIQNGKKVVIK